MPKYFLTVILEDVKKEFPIVDVAMSLGPVIDSQNLRFNYNHVVAIFHFASEVYKKDLYVYIQGVLMGITETFLLTEVNDDVTVSFPQDLKSYMLDLEKGESYSVPTITYTKNGDIQFDDENGKYLVEFSGHQVDEDYDDDEDDFDMDILDIIRQIHNKPKLPSLDYVLDKIIDQGMNSLTKTELEVLKQYSN
jgi:hypothetical protein